MSWRSPLFAILLALAPGASSAAPADSLAPDPASDSTTGQAREREVVTAPATVDSAAVAAAATDSAAADTSRRVTGTAFRFGYTPEMAQRHGDFVVAKVPGRRGEVARSGEGRWLGIDGQFTLFFRRGLLARVEFEVEDPSPNERDYAQDQLRSAGFKRECAPASSVLQTCTWLGRSKVTLEISPASLKATIEPPPVPRRAPVAILTVPELFVIGRNGVASTLPPPTVAANPAPEYPAAAESGRVQGNVWVRAVVDTAGSVVKATVTKSIPELDAAAVQNAMRWRFEPYRFRGQPARFEVEFPVRFILH